MIRLAIIGNSHLSALALAWRELAPRFPEVAITFFGARAYLLDGLRASRRGLAPDNRVLRRLIEEVSGGPGKVVAADHDVFWFAGHDLGVHPVVDTYRRCWAEAHRPDPARLPVSDALFAELCLAGQRRTLSAELVRRFRQASDAPVAMLCQPAPSEAALRPRDYRYEIFQRAERTGDAAALAAATEASLTRLEREEGVRVFRQPEATRARALHTRAEFARGSVRLHEALTSKHGPNDVAHMNAGYGALVLEELLPTLADTRAAGLASAT